MLEGAFFLESRPLSVLFWLFVFYVGTGSKFTSAKAKSCSFGFFNYYRYILAEIFHLHRVKSAQCSYSNKSVLLQPSSYSLLSREYFEPYT